MKYNEARKAEIMAERKALLAEVDGADEARVGEIEKRMGELDVEERKINLIKNLDVSEPAEGEKTPEGRSNMTETESC